MYPRSRRLRYQLLAVGKKAAPSDSTHSAAHRARVFKELRALGMSKLGLRSMESHYLPAVIHPKEHVCGVVYGRHVYGRAMMVATDIRVIFLDCKPLFVNQDEIDYFAVSGISYSHAGFGSTVTVHTHIKDYTIRSLNEKCARGFVAFIERRSLEHRRGSEERMR